MKKFQKHLIALLACSFVTTSMIGLTSCALLAPPTSESESSISTESSVETSTTEDSTSSEESSEAESSSESDTTCVHVFKFETTVEPTCEEVGSKTEFCQNDGCEATGKTEVIAKLGHVWTWGDDVVFDEENPDDKYTGDYCQRCLQTASQGLEYRLDKTEKKAYLKAIGNCTDEKIYLPANIVVDSVKYAVEGVDGTFCGYSFMKRFEIVSNEKAVMLAENAFCYSYGLEEVIFNNAVTALGNNTFLECDVLENVELGNRLAVIESNAFYGCDALKEVILPASLMTLGNHAFENCASLKKVAIGDKTLGVALQTIGAQAFSNNPALVDVQIGEGVVKIGEGAFSKNNALTNVVIPDFVQTIDSYAFAGCANLAEVRIGVLSGNSETTRLNAYAFSDCPALTTIYIPESLSYVYENVFAGATIKNVHISSVSDWCDITFKTPEVNPLYQGNATLYVNGKATTDIVIDDDVTTVRAYAFYNYKNMTSLVIGKNVYSIGNQAFAGCANLEKITFNAKNAKALTLETEAFAYAGHTGMRDEFGNKIYKSIEVEIGADVSMIPAYLFATESGEYDYKTPTLTKVTFAEGSKCSKIGKYAFYSCDRLADVTFGYWKEIEPIDEESEPTYEFVSTLTTIDEGAFEYCEKLQSIILGETMQTINADAFLGCGNVTEVEIPNGCTKIAETAFEGCCNIEKIVYPTSAIKYFDIYSLKDVTITSGVIEADQFHSSSIEKLVIGEGVTSIGEMAFAYSDIKTLDLSNATSLETIGAYAFNECDNLTMVTLDNRISTIGEGAFFYCKNLEQVIIGSGVKTIGKYAFYDCGKLTQARIGLNVGTIGAYAFSGTALTMVDFIDRLDWTVELDKDSSLTDVVEKNALDSTMLADAKKAAVLLSDTYAEYNWTKLSSLE